MSYAFNEEEEAYKQDYASMHPAAMGDVGMFRNFFSGSRDYAMKVLAEGWSGIDLLGAVGPIVQDKFQGGTENQDAYFKEHEDIFNPMIKSWTPSEGDVGAAGQIVGSVTGTLGQVAFDPILPVISTEAGTAEQLHNQGVPTGKAIAAGIVQGTGLGLGIKAPILGNSLFTRIATGAASNAAQGIATRALTRQALNGEKAAEQYNPWDVDARLKLTTCAR